jgi:hypothetical protein
MKRSMVRLGLSLMLAAGWWVQRLPAQSTCSCSSDAQGAVAPENDAEHPHRTFWRRVGNHFGLCCWTTHNHPGCDSLHSEMVFFYGSCHSFFGEPCLVPPPNRLPSPQAIYQPWGRVDVPPP